MCPRPRARAVAMECLPGRMHVHMGSPPTTPRPISPGVPSARGAGSAHPQPSRPRRAVSRARRPPMCAGLGCCELAAYLRSLRTRIGRQCRGAGCAPLVCPRSATGPARPMRSPAPAHRAGLGIWGPEFECHRDAEQAGRARGPGVAALALAAGSWKAGAAWGRAASVIVLMGCLMAAAFNKAVKQDQLQPCYYHVISIII